jgi:hypothetical protein
LWQYDKQDERPDAWRSTVVAYSILDALESAGLVITAPDAPERGMVCISREAANWASWALTGVLADSPEATVVPVVREARDEIYAAIEAAGSDPA